MPFEPRVLSPDDEPPHGEAPSDLPADLEAVAERLRADAAMLAERYPGECSAADIGFSVLGTSTGSFDRRSSHDGRRWRAAAVAAALSLVVLVAGWTVWRMALPPRDTGNSAAEAVVADGIGSVAAPAELVDEDAATVLPSVGASLEFGGAEAFLMNVNGPELEAVLDLMETQDTEDPLLSL
jgi:hypothetical protein